MRTVLPEDPRQQHRGVKETVVNTHRVSAPWYSRAYLARVFARRPAQLLALLAFVVVAAILIYVFAAGSESTLLDLCSGTANGTSCSSGQVTLNTQPTGTGTLASSVTPTVSFPEPAWNQSTNKEGGRVDAVRRVGNTIYVGGNFTVARDLNASSNVTRHYLAAINATTGKLLSWDPEPNGRVYDIEPSSDGSVIYVAGAFTAIGGATRHSLAALNPTTGAVITTFPDFNFDNFVWVVRIYGSTLFAGGQFTGSLSKIDLSSNTKESAFHATASGSGSSPIKDMYLVPGTTRLVVGGWFTSLNSSSTNYLGAVDSNTGASLAWSAHPGQPVLDMTYYNGNILTGEVDDRVVSYNATSGAQNWYLASDGNIQAITLFGSSVIAGMHGDCIAGKVNEAAVRYQTSSTCKTSGTPDGLVRHKIFKLNAQTGAPDTNWGPPMTGGTSLGVWSLDADANGLYAGGDFTSAGGNSNQPRFAFFQAQ